MIPSLLRSRRRRFTCVKWLLIATAFVGVLLWIAQIHSANDIEDQGLIKQHNAPMEVIPDFNNNNKENLHIKAHADETNIDVPKSAFASDIKKITVKLHVPRDPDKVKVDQPMGIGFGQIAPPINHDVGLNSNKKTTTTTTSKIQVIPGLGEMGAPVILKDDEKDIADQLFKDAAFNVYISDRISLNRTVPDARHLECKQLTYERDLPSASIIIIFHNEILSALMRTVHSVINRTPSRMLEEIILVDDSSDRKELKSNLVNELQNSFQSGKVKLIRLSRREGLIRARLAGAKLAVGKVLVFLDSHCEVNIAWLEPLLQKIKNNPKLVVCPIIDIIDDKTLEYQISSGEYFQIGGFTWAGYFSWIDIPPHEEERRKTAVEPARSPTMAGGLFAIDRKYFWEIGGYDEKMDTWGGENLELSFRVWMCGGELLIVPCSHVGHIFRSFHPYAFPGSKDSHGINTVRTVEVWMGDYKKYFYFHRPDLKNIDYGDIQQRLKIKDDLKCKDFGWYLKNVFPDKFVLDQNVFGYGSVRNPNSELCLDTFGNDDSVSHDLGASQCQDGDTININQFFSFSNIGELRREENCATVTPRQPGFQAKVTMVKCDTQSRSQKWIHHKGGPIVNMGTGKCLDSGSNQESSQVYVMPCRKGHSQVWWFNTYDDIKLEINQEGP